MIQKQTELDPVTFEVLKNAFANLVDQMAEQILRTCYSFVIYCRDFSAALCDVNGDTIMQGSQDIAVHVGTMHLTAKAVISAFGDDIHEGDIFIFNDPYTGGTHFCDVRVVKPVFYKGEIVAYTQTNNTGMIKLFNKLPYKVDAVLEGGLLLLKCNFENEQ